jgi:hypothetical protein
VIDESEKDRLMAVLLRMLVLATVITLVGCGGDSVEVHTYEVVYPKGELPENMKKETAVASEGHGDHDGHDHGDHDGHDHPPVKKPATPVPSNGYAWTTPEGWKSLPAGGMRVGSFQLANLSKEDFDCSITKLGPVAGGLADNINRWRRQINLQPLDAAAIEESVERLKTDSGLLVVRTQLNSAEGNAPTSTDRSMRVAIIEEADATIFIKLVGRHDAVAANAAGFDALVASFRRD